MQEERSKDPGLNRLGIPARTRPPRVAKQGFRPVSGLTQTVDWTVEGQPSQAVRLSGYNDPENLFKVCCASALLR